MRKRTRMIGGLMMAAALYAGPAFGAVDGEEAYLVATTVSAHPAHTEGRLDATAPGVLTFHANGGSANAISTDLVMPYDKVFEFGLSEEDAFHLGFFPAMFYGMVAPRPKRHVFTVSWHGVDGEAQVATFEVSKSFSQHLLPVMYARARGACVRKEFNHEYSNCTPVVPAPLPPRLPLTSPASSPQPAAEATANPHKP